VDVQAKILEMITVLRDQTELLELTEAVRANLSANAKDLCKQIQHDLATNELDYSSSRADDLISAPKPHSASINHITIPLRDSSTNERNYAFELRKPELERALVIRARQR
jgi:hypothetical protein